MQLLRGPPGPRVSLLGFDLEILISHGTDTQTSVNCLFIYAAVVLHSQGSKGDRGFPVRR